jgi:hypothetical protein
MVRYLNYYERVVIPELITSGAIDGKTTKQARAIIKTRIGVEARAAWRILAELERRGLIRRDPAQLPRIHIIKK